MTKHYLTRNIAATAIFLGLVSSLSLGKGKRAHVEVVPASALKWEKLNPARGSKSPQAATVWGDRQANVATGFLVKFVDGFSSPPHIHNVSYRGVVIRGLVHNDDPKAANMWMPPGSFWTQPKGESHITSAKGRTNVAYIEIDAGPYLVRPVDKAFDSGERPVNIDPSNLVWLSGTHIKWLAKDKVAGVHLAFLWGEPGRGKFGAFLKLPAGFKGRIKSRANEWRAVVVSGMLVLKQAKWTKLDAGSYVFSSGKASHKVRAGKQDVVVYLSTDDTFRVASKG